MPKPTTRPAPPAGLEQELSELFGTYGWPKMTGRILGVLLTSEQPYLSSADLCACLPSSKAHLSETITVLLKAGLVERFGIAGSRRDHYRLTPDAFVHAVRQSFEALTVMADTAVRAQALAPAESRAGAELARMGAFYAFLARRMPALADEFEAAQQAAR